MHVHNRPRHIATDSKHSPDMYIFAFPGTGVDTPLTLIYRHGMETYIKYMHVSTESVLPFPTVCH